MKIAVTIFSGNPEFFFGVKPEIKYPSETSSDAPSTISESFSQGKTYIFKSDYIN
jgi:hypothetical protein